ncbi:methyltransferase domain-containing protein [Candidatus Uhrbacteria bacterium]|nr:methyltransferase domain-containing protein [Candidatus Uhrbacteria bacterium]
MLWWLKKLVKNPAVIGSVAPSGPSLAKLMTRDIPTHARVLELGPGEGAITQQILKKLSSPSQLELIEFDRDLGQICRTKFPGVAVHHGDVEDFLRDNDKRYDFIVSGIPFAAMDKAKRQRVFNLIRDHLADDGSYVMFQYSVTTLGELKKIFRDVDTGFTPLNVPPAFVFTCKK